MTRIVKDFLVTFTSHKAEYDANEARRTIQFQAGERAVLILAFEWAKRSLVHRQGGASDVQIFDKAESYLQLGGFAQIVEKLRMQSFNTNLRMASERKGSDKNTLLILKIMAESGYVMGQESIGSLIEWVQKQDAMGSLAFSRTYFGRIAAAGVYNTQERRWPFYNDFIVQLDRVARTPITTFDDFARALYATPETENSSGAAVTGELANPLKRESLVETHAQVTLQPGESVTIPGTTIPFTNELGGPLNVQVPTESVTILAEGGYTQVEEPRKHVSWVWFGLVLLAGAALVWWMIKNTPA